MDTSTPSRTRLNVGKYLNKAEVDLIEFFDVADLEIISTLRERIIYPNQLEVRAKNNLRSGNLLSRILMASSSSNSGKTL